MAHNPITLDLLRALDAIDQRGSFAAAAQALHKVPSALTYTVQKVEQDLGIELFDRSGHRAKLTPAGRLVLEEGRDILRDMDSLASSAKKIASGWEPELRIGVDTFFEANRLFPLIATFNAEHPYIKLHLMHGSLTGTWEMLINGSADLILSARNLDPKLEGYETQSLGPTNMAFVVAQNHPLAERACEVSIEEIEQYPTIVVRDTTQLMAPRTVGWTRQNRVITVPTMSDKIDAQKAGLGVGYLPTHRIKTELAEGSLVPVRVDTPIQEDEALIAWRKGVSGEALKWFREKISGELLGIQQPA
ncbi:LysR substrate-binding domain-containing protein [Saccharospirillum mangrovi]|uniref:LysR substrate-binding domain-containing protein n=1 Tax=Saccharospirillum mangrovi TaxID=2161747 RepID=UPI000D3AB191|nr:LysR substrate-binding domain-containing protein [Saccharospirillum mangrovi]